MKHLDVYRRRRIGALLAATLLACTLYAQAGSADSPSVPYTVDSGDTLWDIATRNYPSTEDPRVVIENIREENSLEGYVLQPGQHLNLPR